MICLDTNYLIMGLVDGSIERSKLVVWAKSGEQFCASSIVWYEFLCGPVTRKQIEAVKMLLSEIIAFDDALSADAADLFNAIGRSRKMRVDSMIAASAMRRGVPLATSNIQDFSRFAEFGLRII